jgi:hypothetical protein
MRLSYFSKPIFLSAGVTTAVNPASGELKSFGLSPEPPEPARTVAARKSADPSDLRIHDAGLSVLTRGLLSRFSLRVGLGK